MSTSEIVVIEKPRELSVTEVKAQVMKVQELMRDLMQDGTHYGQSYQGDTKKNLLKPGADKLCFMFRLRPDFTQEIKDIPGGHMEVLTRCHIFHIESGQKIAEGVGLASTMESKYRWRNAARKCPSCGKETIIIGKKEYGGGFICFSKKGGCGAKFKDDDPAIIGQATGKVENSDIADTYNTVIKMSKKRAYVDATITACAASDIFTQDAEDLKDITETTELAHEAAREDHAPPLPSKTREELLEEYNAARAELRNIMDTKGPGNTPIFTQAEFQAVSNTLADMKGRSAKDHVDLIQRLLAEKKVQLKDRIAAFEPDPPAPANPVPATPPPSAPAAPPQGKQGRAAPAKTKDQPESLKEEFQRRVAGSEREKTRVTQTAPVAAAVPPVPEMYSQEEDDGFEDDLPEGFMEAGEEAPAEAELDIF